MKNKVRKQTLKNGLKIIFLKKESKSVSIQVTVKVGSNYENSSSKGISHFIEHMLFEGTKKRDALQIAREIEGIGGEIGAYTSNERTCYYVNCLKRHFEKGVEILSDIIINPQFDEKMLEKERGVILSEIHMRTDEPRMHQWRMFLSNLYQSHPTRHPIIGYSGIIKKIDRKWLKSYHRKHYTPENMIISVAGKPNSFSSIKKYFGEMNRGKESYRLTSNEPLRTKTASFSENRKISQSYMVIGSKTAPRKEKDSHSLDVIKSILGKGLSGRLFNEVRTKRGLAYDVGIHHEAKSNYGFFAYYISTDRKNLGLCRKIFLNELKKLDNLEEEEIIEAKNHIEGDFIMRNEDNHSLTDSMGEWAARSDLSGFFRYIERIKKVTKKDILDARDRFLKTDFVTVKILQK